MRSITKLKRLLLKYDASLSMNDSGEMTLIMKDKDTGNGQLFKATSWTELLKEPYEEFMDNISPDEKALTYLIR